MAARHIPPNDPKNPRWLLDLDKWEIVPFTNVPRDILDSEGYSIVSYTWGYIQDRSTSATGAPRNVFWDVPRVTEWDLEEAKAIMKKIGCRFIWWDWMCVPQRGKQPLDQELSLVQGQEIGKQMHIYSNAKKSAVWLHSSSWEGPSALKELVQLGAPQAEDQEPSELHRYVERMVKLIDNARAKERWLVSGWTLQEGVLLHETNLIDRHGLGLFGPDFWLGEQATVSDLTVHVNKTAWELAMGYFISSQGHEPAIGAPIPPTSNPFGLSKLPETWLRTSLKSLVDSGLAFYWKDSPLQVLAGKRKRQVNHVEDKCWGLIGALGLEDVEVKYGISLQEAECRLLEALVRKYQWRILSLPFPEFQVPGEEGEPAGRRLFTWSDIARGVMLPVEIFAIEIESRPLSSDAGGLPTISFNRHDGLDMQIECRDNTTLYRMADTETASFRHYRQDDEGLRIVAGGNGDGLLSKAWLLPLHWIGMKPGVSGRRCLALLDLTCQESDAMQADATFGGIIDVQQFGEEELVVNGIRLGPCLC